MKDILVFVPSGFEDAELIVTLDIFKREGVTYDLVSPEQLDRARGKYEAYVNTKKMRDMDSLMNYKGLFLPGGPGHVLYAPDKQVMDTIKQYKADGKLLTAICAAPSALEAAGVIENEIITAHPGFAENSNPTGKEVEVSNNMITGRDYLATSEFAFAIVKKIKG